MNDGDMLEGLALRLVQGLEELRVNWWIFNGWSFRKVGQLELEVEVSNGRGRDDTEREHQPEGELEAEMAPGADDGDSGSRKTLRAPLPIRSTKSAKRLLKAAKPPSRLGKAARGRLRKRGWR